MFNSHLTILRWYSTLTSHNCWPPSLICKKKLKQFIYLLFRISSEKNAFKTKSSLSDFDIDVNGWTGKFFGLVSGVRKFRKFRELFFEESIQSRKSFPHSTTRHLTSSKVVRFNKISPICKLLDFVCLKPELRELLYCRTLSMSRFKFFS